MDLKQVAVNKKRSMIELKSPVDEICSICIESVKNKRVKILPCGHRYHVSCINKWLNSKKNTCAKCRCVVDSSKVVASCKDPVDSVEYQSIVDLLRVIESLFEINNPVSILDEDLSFSEDEEVN